MNCPQCGHESFSLPTSDVAIKYMSSAVNFSSDTGYSSTFVCEACRWHSPPGIANTQSEAEKIAKNRMKTMRQMQK